MAEEHTDQEVAQAETSPDAVQNHVAEHYGDVVEKAGDNEDAEPGSQLTEAPRAHPLAGENVIAPSVAEKWAAHNKVVAQRDKCRKVFNRILYSYFELGKEIITLREYLEEMNGKRPSRMELANTLGLPITEERISQIVLTSEKFHKVAKKTIDFKVYEVARELDGKSIIKREVEELAQLIESNPTTSKLKKAMESTEPFLTVAVRKNNKGIYKLGAQQPNTYNVIDMGIASLVAIAALSEKAEECLKRDDLRRASIELDYIDERYRDSVLLRLMDIAKRNGDDSTLEALQERFDASASASPASE